MKRCCDLSVVRLPRLPCSWFTGTMCGQGDVKLAEKGKGTRASTGREKPSMVCECVSKSIGSF